MQTNSVWKYRDGLLVKKFPKTPYIDTVYNIWCGTIYHVCNDPYIEWTTDSKLYPHVSEYGYGVLAEETPNVQWQSVQSGFFGMNCDIDEVVRYFNDFRNYNDVEGG